MCVSVCVRSQGGRRISKGGLMPPPPPNPPPNASLYIVHAAELTCDVGREDEGRVELEG